MTGNTYHIVKHFFKTDSLENVSVKQLEDASAQYPFFGLAHYLLSKKLYLRKEDRYSDETKKTALYFTNPFWMQWLLENSVNEKLPELKTSAIEEFKKLPSLNHEPARPLFNGETLAQIKTNENANSKDEELLFEPYHTVDYFASQGIKVPDEVRPDDKFGKQLKSFTEWLKVMKKLPQKNINVNLETSEQATIDGFAAHSLQQKEILTEAMAEVLLKQGKNEDAIGLYRKLSLINPSKSAYFAAKIEQLNS